MASKFAKASTSNIEEFLKDIQVWGDLNFIIFVHMVNHLSL